MQPRLRFRSHAWIRTFFGLALVALSRAQAPDAKLPRFEKYPISEHWPGPAATLKLTTRSERMFRTQLLNAAKEPPNFAGHYKMTYWECGSVCAAGALIDLVTGDVYPPPLAKVNGGGWERWIMCSGSFEGANDEFRVDSRMMIARCFSEVPSGTPDTQYLLWEGNRFRQILKIPGKPSN